MSDITFDGHTHMLTFTDSAGQAVGTWPANNRTTSDAKPRFLTDGVYFVFDRIKPNPHHKDVHGAYGLHGIIRLKKPDGSAWGVGIHAGRQAYHLISAAQPGTGAYYNTEGCIRTTEAAMDAITARMKKDPLLRLFVRNNHLQTHLAWHASGPTAAHL